MSAITPYELGTGQKNTSFEFISEGPKGKIEKLILFDLIHLDDESIVYNLAFGDKDKNSGELNDLVVSANGDTDKVLSTIVAAVILFLYLQNKPNFWVYATGSTPARTRLYRIGISKYYESKSSELILLGETSAGWEPFREGIDYTAFICKKCIFEI